MYSPLSFNATLPRPHQSYIIVYSHSHVLSFIDHSPFGSPAHSHRSSALRASTSIGHELSVGPQWRSAPPAGLQITVPVPGCKRAIVLPSDIDESGALKASMVAFPDSVVKVMKAGFNKHLPLDMLTSAYAEREAINPSTEFSIIRTRDDGSLESTEKSHPHDKERNLSYQVWCEASQRLIQLIRLYYPGPDRSEIADAFNIHFSTLRDDCMASKMWEVFLAYDVRVHRTFVSHGVYPKAFQPNFFVQEQQEWLVQKTNSITSIPYMPSTRYHPYERAPVDRPFRSTEPSTRYYPYDRPVYDRPPADRPFRNTEKMSNNRPFRARTDNTRLLCIFCGTTGHPSRECSNNKPFLVQNTRNEWVAPDGTQICYQWNGNSTLCVACTRKHVCSLCGGDHHAKACQLARL